MELIKSLALNTCIDSCNGMCKKILKDSKKLFPHESDLLIAYRADKENGGRDYQSIIELGIMLKKLEENTDVDYNS